MQANIYIIHHSRFSSDGVCIVGACECVFVSSGKVWILSITQAWWTAINSMFRFINYTMTTTLDKTDILLNCRTNGNENELIFTRTHTHTLTSMHNNQKDNNIEQKINGKTRLVAFMFLHFVFLLLSLEFFFFFPFLRYFMIVCSHSMRNDRVKTWK